MNNNEKYCRDMLPKVSRTFAACIKLLPNKVELPVLIAYLLCRIADTIEDNPEMLGREKEKFLDLFKKTLVDKTVDLKDLQDAFSDPSNDDQSLTNKVGIVLSVYYDLPSNMRDAISPWVIEMCEGMAAFSMKYEKASPDNLQALDTVSELEKYCYFVAGTVGHLLTEIFNEHHRRLTKSHYTKLKKLATSFGLGLQLTNIIKDVADDNTRGWSFVPVELCEKYGIEPKDLLNEKHSIAAKQVMQELISKTESYLYQAMEYCIALPRTAWRIRLFCATPLFFAIKTLRKAKFDEQILDPKHKVKITRKDVYKILRDVHVVAGSNYMLKKYCHKLYKGK